MSLPPSEIPLGAMRFNSDSQKLEYWMGSAWMQIKTFSPNLDGGVRGFAAGGSAPGYTATIDFYTISTQGDASDFGDLTLARGNGMAGLRQEQEELLLVDSTQLQITSELIS